MIEMAKKPTKTQQARLCIDILKQAQKLALVDVTPKGWASMGSNLGMPMSMNDYLKIRQIMERTVKKIK